MTDEQERINKLADTLNGGQTISDIIAQAIKEKLKEGKDADSD